jgi:putative ABC transport system ATP-binding protein
MMSTVRCWALPQFLRFMILAACKRGVAAVVVTHDAQLASWADRVIFLRDGRVVDQTVPPPSLEALLEESSGPRPRR